MGAAEVASRDQAVELLLPVDERLQRYGRPKVSRPKRFRESAFGIHEAHIAQVGHIDRADFLETGFAQRPDQSARDGIHPEDDKAPIL